MTLKYEDYQFLLFEHRANGVLVVTINRPEKLNAANDRMLLEYAEIWNTVKYDPKTRVVIITGAGRAFSAGGDLNGDLAKLGHAEPIIEMGENALNIVYNMVHLDKVIISAITSVQALGNYATSNVLRCAWLAEAKTLAFALGERGIHINTLSLGGTLTPDYMASLQRRAEQAGVSFAQRLADETSNIPLAKYGRPEEVAVVVEQLLGALSDHMTGANLLHDGGFTRAY